MRMNLRTAIWLTRDSLVHSHIWLLVVIVLLSWHVGTVLGLTSAQVASLRKETEDLFYHGYENYMKLAFPEDELRPITCQPLTRDRQNPAHIELNDPLGNYSLTLVDSLSTLAILASTPSGTKRNKPLLLFQNGIKDFVEQYGDGTKGPAGAGARARGFDLDSKVQVFETAIRGLGGLLSSHLFAVGDLPIRGYSPKEHQARYARLWHNTTSPISGGIKWKNGMQYNGQLLRLAYDLGNRLLPAFWTPTGIPYPRVNLRSGIPFYLNSPLHFNSEHGQCDVQQPTPTEITETCSAGAGSLVLEFTVLSRLTGDPRFEESAKRAFWGIWNRRSNLDLVGAGIDAETGTWVSTWTGIGAGIDSFFEYALKSYVLLSQDSHPIYSTPDNVEDPRTLFAALTPEEDSPGSFYSVWQQAHAAINRHLYRGPNYQHPHYIQADLLTGAAKGFWIDALSAYYPGLLTLGGHVEEAIGTHLLQTALWTRFSGIPERWNLLTGGVEGGLGWWVGRPEFIESNYYLYRATEDPWYLHVGEMALRDIKRRCWTKCGWASIQNVLTGEKTDRMESFFLGETAKYLFLLFDSTHPLNKMDGPVVFTTEGHPLIIPPSIGIGVEHGKLRDLSAITPGSCPVKPAAIPFSISSTAARQDVYHAASLARLHLMPSRDQVESVLGDYAADHPSITLSDISSPSNYTYFPWTLPLSLIPFNATSAPMPTRPTFDISFPALPNQGQPVAPLQRVKDGILINFIGGLRLGMIQDVPVFEESGIFDGYRIQAINSLALGKDEKVFLARDTGHGILNPIDPNFTKIRDITMLDIVIDAGPVTQSSIESNITEQTPIEIPLQEQESETESSAVKSTWNSLFSQIANLIKDKQQIPASLGGSIPLVEGPTNNPSRFYAPAITPTGIGAAPIPDWPDASTTFITTAGVQSARLQWTKIFATDDLCDYRLPLHIVRTYQVLLVRRGGCPFSRKLSNIPAYRPSPTALQLVIVVSFGSTEKDRSAEAMSEPTSAANEGPQVEVEETLIRPLLDELQATSNGLLRHNPIPMVMVAGGQKTYDVLKSASGVGIKRRYTVHTQGVPIVNLVLL